VELGASVGGGFYKPQDDETFFDDLEFERKSFSWE
jgi:hypothetical protein